MLALKKFFKKKLIAYFIIIGIIMMSGTVFFIYQNYKITSNSDLDFITPEAEIGTDIDFETDINFTEEAGVRTNNVVKPLDISIFNNSKFKALKEIVFRETEVEVGRKNPFENPFNLSNK
ncbi:hypothetical protein KAU19_02540 [Candidatus Parcubacteria bacterium]|nr:hypothetical protein [Candidatus Parcubacteria bacterium]